MDEKPFSLSKDVLKVLSVDTRIKILKALNERQMTASELSRKLGKHVTTITEHLDHLNEAGLIERFETAGKKLVYYKLTHHGKSITQPKSYTNIVLMLSISLIVIIAGWLLIPSLFNNPVNFSINTTANGNVPVNPTESETGPLSSSGSETSPISSPSPETGSVTLSDYGTLVLMITDKFDMNNVSSINITIEAVDVHKEDANWTNIVNTTKSFNLIELIGIEEFLGESNLSIGNYTQIRLEISNASITINDIEYSLKIPSEEIKLIHPFTIETSETITLVLDFIAAESIIEQGKGYILKPTIKIIEK